MNVSFARLIGLLDRSHQSQPATTQNVCHWRQAATGHVNQLLKSQSPSRATMAHRAVVLNSRLCSRQPDTNRSCKSTDMGLVWRVECLFSSQLASVPIYTAWWTEARVWTTFPESLRGAERPDNSNLRPLGCKSDVLGLTATAPHQRQHRPAVDNLRTLNET